MLNELMVLEQGLAQYGVTLVSRHPDLSQLLKADIVRVRLAAGGGIDKIELLDRKGPEVWTLRDGKHNGFPGLKTTRGLLQLHDTLRADHDARWRAARNPAAKRAEIERLVHAATPDPDAGDWPKPGHRARIGERLRELRPLEADPDARAVPAVFERFLQGLQLRPPFLHRLLDSLLDHVRNGDDAWLDLARAALVDPVPLAFDVTDGFTRDAGDARQIAAVSRTLSGSADGGRQGICAMTGRHVRLLDGNFPQPTLPSLGQTYLFSRNTDIRALARYGRNGPSSMPVEAELVGRFSGALSAIAAKAREGRTWRLLPAESGDAQDLFIAFVASQMDAAVAGSLAQGGMDDEEDETPRIGPAQVEAAAERLVRFWDGVAERARPGELVRILILRTVDPGNRKAAYDRSPSVDQLHSAARGWAEAMHNAPDWIGWPVIDRKTRKYVKGRPRLERPLSLIPLSRRMYVRGGREAVDVPGISGAEALALFLNEGARPRRARRILRLLLDRQTGLLVGIASAKLRGKLKEHDPKATIRDDALRSVSWMGALLAFIDPTGKNYMDGTGFKLGQLLAAADAVHAGYCMDVRGGDMPPTLVGNSVFAAAGRNPDRALDVLQTRWKPYHAWVHRLCQMRRDRPEDGDARGWTIVEAMRQARRATQLCEELHPALAHMRSERRAPDEAFRAELLLGYVAGLRAEKKNAPASNKEEPDT